MFPLVSIVVLNTNDKVHLTESIPSIMCQSYPNFELILVDNASTDGSVEYVSSHYPKVRIVQNESNLGYAGGNNEGIMHAIGEYIVVLNPDVVVDRKWLIELVRTMQRTKADLVTSKILLYDQGDRINACGNNVHISGLAFCNGLGEPEESYYEDQELTAISGCSFIVKKEVLNLVGLFDRDFFIYLEDTDLSLRVKMAGYRILLSSKSRVYHKYSFKLSPKKFYLLEKNRYQILLKIFCVKTLILLLPVILLTEFLVWFFAILKGVPYVSAKARADGWLIVNHRKIIVKRKETASKKKLQDRHLLMELDYKIPFNQYVDSKRMKPLGNVVNIIYGKLRHLIVFFCRW